MKHSAAVCCAAAFFRCCERRLKQVRVKSQSSFVFTGVATVHLTSSTENTRKLKILPNCRKSMLRRRQKQGREINLHSVQYKDKTR